MEQDQLLSALGDWTGFRVVDVYRREVQPAEIWITLEPDQSKGYRCSRCGKPTTKVHEHTVREIRDLPLFDAATFLKVTVYRVWCDHCGGPKRMEIDWLDDHQRVTKRLAASIISLCSVLAIDHVARHYRLHWHTVKRIDKRALSKRLDPADFSGVSVIGLDEFALHKGHRYATVVVEPSTKRVLWVGRGRGRRDVRPFFELLGDQCQYIKAAVIDMNASYELEVQAHCPNAEVVFDLFHVIAKYGREVLDRVRVDEANRLRDDKPARQVVKSSKWLLLRNRDNASDDDRIRLDELLAANQSLMCVYVLRDDLRTLWRMRDAAAAQIAWEHWYQRAIDSGIDALIRFARRLKPYLHGILAHCRWPLHTGLIEGMNNRIKVIKRMAYGYRDEAYFFLKIRAAFPGYAR